jgi:hypothetical protein
MRKFFAQILFCVVAISSTAFGQVIANGLIGHWSGNNTTADSSSGGNNGTFVAQSASYGTGVFGQAFNINGGYVAVPDSNAWTFAGDFTITLWANASSVSGAFVSHDQGGGSLPKWIFWNTGSNALGFHVNGPEGSANIDTGASSLTDNRWYHLAITRSGNQFTLYIDGSAVTGATNSIVFENANASLILAKLKEDFSLPAYLTKLPSTIARSAPAKS